MATRICLAISFNSATLFCSLNCFMLGSAFLGLAQLLMSNIWPQLCPTNEKGRTYRASYAPLEMLVNYGINTAGVKDINARQK